MICNRLSVALLGMLRAEEADPVNAQIARYLLRHADTLGTMSVKDLAGACHVGTGTVSRFAREAGFADFAELRGAVLQS